MAIRVEFYGIPRQRAGVATTTVQARTLGAALAALSADFPALAAECFPHGELHKHVTANLNGARFISDPDTLLSDGDCLLILGADAGG